MTDDMVGREALERKEDWFFLAEEVRGLLTLSPKFAALCRRMLAGGSGGFREFELALRGALLAGAAAGASEVLSALDGELEAPPCGECGSARRRRGTRSISPLSLLGRLSLRRGYWTCKCPKGGVHLLDRALGIAGRAGVRLTPAALWALAEEAAEKSFAKAAERLGRLAGVAVTAKRAERGARQAGREIAAWEESAPFGKRLWRAAERFGFALAKRQVVIGDGAKWIWNTAAEQFPKAICIVDVWHAKERLWEVGRAVCGVGTELCRAWSEKVCAALAEGRVGDVLAELRRHAGDKTVDEAIGYFENNRSRMRYPEYRRMGLLIGSGMVESSCGNLVAARFKRGGMRWSKAGAYDILALRACVQSGLYDDYWRYRRKPPPLAA